jgi:hypothetical protein
MRLYYDPDTGNPRFTLKPGPQMARAPDGPFIEVPDDPDLPLEDIRVVAGEVVLVSLEGQRASAIAAVNAAAAVVRGRLVTDLPGQEMLYLRKEAEARAWLADPDPEPDLALYPFLAAEVGATAPSADQVAQVYLNMAALWTAIGAALEALRLGAIAEIETTEEPGTIVEAVAGFRAALAAARWGDGA